MKIRHRSTYTFVILLAFLICLVILIQVLLVTDLVGDQTSPLNRKRTAIIEHNQTIQVMIYLTQTATAQGIGGPLPEWYTISPDTSTPLLTTLIPLQAPISSQVATALSGTATAQSETGTFTPTPSS